jgi:hypothetical protein
LQKVAEGCRRLQKVAEGCRRLQKVAEGWDGKQKALFPIAVIVDKEVREVSSTALRSSDRLLQFQAAAALERGRQWNLLSLLTPRTTEDASQNFFYRYNTVALPQGKYRK